MNPALLAIEPLSKKNIILIRSFYFNYQTFIFVRPPPSKTNHPLNLQVQLVPPNTKPPGGVTDNDGDTTTPNSGNSANSKYTSDGAPLARTSSSRSSVSYTSTSYGSSTTSFSSFSSTSARRTIIPLYNLQAHNVMTNVIVDAGTDAKIAKFQKRGIELIDLALLEPVEVWGEGGREKDVRRESMRIVADEMGASVVVNAGGGRGLLSAKPPTTFLQPGGSRPVTPSAASSATSLHSQTSLANSSAHNSTIQTPIPQHLSSQTIAMDQPAQPRSNVALAATGPFTISHSNSISSSSNNPTPMPSAPPSSMSLAMMSPPATPVSGTASGKRNLFNKLFNRKQNGTELLSPSESGSPVFSRPQYSQPARSQPPPMITTTECNQPESEVSPPPTFASFASAPGPGAVAGTERSFGSRSNSMKRRSAPPPALIEPPFSNPKFATSGLGTISDLSPPIEQTTPTQMSVALGAKATTVSTMPPPTPGMVEVPRERERERGKGHGRNMSLGSITSPLKATLKSRLSSAVLMGGGGSQSNSQAHSSGSNVDNIPPPSNKKGQDKDRDASPHPSLSSSDRGQSGSSCTNDSADSHNRIGGGGVTGKGSLVAGGIGGGIGYAPQQAVMTQAQAQSEIMMNLRQQQLQLRPAVLGIQPTFVSSNPSSVSSNLTGSPDALSTTENLDHVPGQRALMYVWLVRRWMKKRTWGHGGLSGFGDSAVGFLGGVVGGLKGEKDKEKAKEKERDRDKKKGNSGDGLGAVTAPLMYGGVEVRFEWKRARSGSKKKTRSGKGRGVTMGSGGVESDGEVDTSIGDRTRERGCDERSSIRESDGGGRPKTKTRLKSEEKKKYRMSTGSLNSIANSEMYGGELEMKKKSSTIGNDDGEDSDPEDSETPWICTLKLRRGAASGAGGSLLNPVAGNAQSQPPILQTQVLRIKVGTLSPTPHHPKVVAMLKVPFPLPNVEVERMGVVRRPGVIGEGVPPQDSNGGQDTPYHGLTLTADEIKDVVCSTGLWLVVREGFGGVGRVSRKGDGWRIRP